MDPFDIALLTVGFLFAYLVLGVWVFVAILMVGISSLGLLLDFPLDRLGSIMRSNMWKTASSYELASVPMFILMGEIIFRTNISDKLFRGLSPWVSAVPGRLLHCNVAGCTLFAAISGSSTATTATVGKITLTELDSRGYDRNLSMGSLAGAGSLGAADPALHRHDHLRHPVGDLDSPSVRRRPLAGADGGVAVLRLYRLSRADRGQRGARAAPALSAAHLSGEPAGPAADPDPAADRAGGGSIRAS